MRPLLLLGDAYLDEIVTLLLIAGLLVGGLIVLVVLDAKARAARPKVPTPAPPANLWARLDWLEWLLLVAVILVTLLSGWR